MKGDLTMHQKNFRTYDLAMKLYKECAKIKSRKDINDQLYRASLSICLNLAEGSGKSSLKDRARFYEISMGSLRETQCLLEILNKTELLKLADILGAHLYRLIQRPGPS